MTLKKTIRYLYAGHLFDVLHNDENRESIEEHTEEHCGFCAVVIDSGVDVSDLRQTFIEEDVNGMHPLMDYLLEKATT